MDEGARRRLVVVGRWVATGAVIAVLVWRVDLRAVSSRLEHLDRRWMAAHLALSVPFYLLVAGRWWLTAARIGTPMPYRRAVLDYYLSSLLNQVLPLGVAGDVVRVARQGGGPATWAVVLERFSGVLGLALFVVASAVVWMTRGRAELASVGAGALALLAVAALVTAYVGRRSSLLGPARQALWERGAFALQLGMSAAAVALMLAQFTCAGRAAGARLDLVTVVQVVPLVLAATTLPWAFGGWGAREATTAALYRLLGLDAATGVAVSISFGLLNLLAVTPGLVVLVLPRGRR
jgi:glycosyltransferase 2 family protein